MACAIILSLTLADTKGCIAMPRHFTEEEKELIRGRLLDVGLEMFERYGLDKTNIEGLTREAGISKASF